MIMHVHPLSLKGQERQMKVKVLKQILKSSNMSSTSDVKIH